MHKILDDKRFNVERDLFLNIKDKPDDEEHSTRFTLLDLNYDSNDVVDRIRELTVAEYSETLVDRDDINPPRLFVFGKMINNKLVYIKLKVKGEPRQRILCISFHYAKDPMEFPYL
ncbi:MAG: hypothetical protein II699_03445 [Lachnospiraceae bacterium]|nr:hypothetical protein [Lachnospiraceae bacterium]